MVEAYGSDVNESACVSGDSDIAIVSFSVGRGERCVRMRVTYACVVLGLSFECIMVVVV